MLARIFDDSIVGLEKAIDAMNRSYKSILTSGNNIVSTDNEWSVEIPQAGLDKSKIEAYVDDDVLKVKYSETKKTDGSYYARSFEQSVLIPENVEKDFTSSYVDGVLKFTAKKKLEAKKEVKAITIN